MKKIKLIIILIISLILIGLLINKVTSYPGDREISINDLNHFYGSKNNAVYYRLTGGTPSSVNNLYCVEHGYKLPDSNNFYCDIHDYLYYSSSYHTSCGQGWAYNIWENKAKIVIDDTEVKYYKVDAWRNETFYNSRPKEELDYQIAAILSEQELGMYSSGSTHTVSQKALYHIWNSWVKLKYGSNVGLTGGNNNPSNSDAFDSYKTYWENRSYKVTIYFLEPIRCKGYQNLILVNRDGWDERIPPTIDISVTKDWKDGENRYGTRPESITVKLYRNDSYTGKSLTLKAPQWRGTFTELESGTGYSVVEESALAGYATQPIKGNQTEGYTITNTLLTEVKVEKQWDDKDNFDEFRPSSLKVTLYSNAVSTGKTVTLDENNKWTATFEELKKYDNNGNEIIYTVKEENIVEYEKTEYKKEENSNNGYITWTITNKHTPHYDGYIEVSGKVWYDGENGKGNEINGILDDKDSMLEGILVRLKYIDSNGKHQLFNPNLQNVYETKTNSNGEYTIRVNYDNSQNVYKLYEDIETVNEKMKTAYVEFEYDGMLYTTVRTSNTGENTSKATENETTRNIFDGNHATVTSGTTHPDNWTDKNITAVTNKVTSYECKSESQEIVVKYCNGNGTYIRTNPDGAWKDILSGTQNLACNNGQGHELNKYGITIQKITNINLGLFEREQPDVAIFSDLTKVEVEMNNQKYTYLYGVRNNNPDTPEGLKVKFQNKNTYTYRRPVNPADIAYIQEETNSNKMSVKVTYEIKVANLSSTLKTVVHKIANYFDNNYTLNTGGWIEMASGGEFKKVTKDINIILDPLSQSDPIELTYTVNVNTIKGLLNQEATLNNAVEIEEYSTYYGDDTLYAEQRTGGRAGKQYAGYDYNSHPGNANIKLMTGEDGVERLYSTDINGNRISIDNLEDDTDIAPSFVLCKDAHTSVSGIVWEDDKSEKYASDSRERLGDGWRDDDENEVENVKIELYEVDNAGNIGAEPATLYTVDSKGRTNTTLASIYTGNDGKYTFEGLVTGKEYLIKYTYGNDKRELGGKETTINVKNSTTKNEVNARNYKSTIITDEDLKIKNILETEYSRLSTNDKMWPLTHKDRYSVAVDNMEDRLSIGVLKNSTYNNGENMTAYTKPFIIPLEFDFTLGTTGNSDKDGNVNDSNGVTIGNVLNKFDFGIIERPREELIVQKTISYFKITLANGQLLIEGNPNDSNANINYTKAIGFRESTSVEEARRALEKRLLVEIDSELIQGAKLEVTYAVKIINNNEIDYEYGELTDYTNGYIAKGEKASYYYYGNRNGRDEMKSIIKFVDYLDAKLAYEEDTRQWKQADAVELNANGFINEEVKNELSKGKYLILQNEINEPGGSSIIIPRGMATEPRYMTTNKLLANRDDNTFYNHAEIIEIDGKTGRTIKGKYEDESQIKYTPGNYNPSIGPNESDDDSVNITITPPTGITNYIVTYVITGLVGLIIIFVAVIFIKKKVLNN